MSVGTQASIKVDIDPELGRVICRVAAKDHRLQVIKAIQQINPETRPRVQDGYIVLDFKTAVALRLKVLNEQIVWSELAARFVDLLIRGQKNLGAARKRLIELQNQKQSDSVLADYDLLHDLDPHQRIAVAIMTDPLIHGLCLFDEQGSGKTVMAIHAFDRLKKMGLADVLLILAPKNMLSEWEKDFRRFTGGSYSISVIHGSRKTKYLKLTEAADVFITNYETTLGLQETMASLAGRHYGRLVLVVDESFFVKNRDAQRSSAVRRLRYFADRCWVLCGTPAPNSALDVVHQFDIADGGITFIDFVTPDDPMKLMEAVKERVESCGLYLRRLKTHVFPNLPAKEFHIVRVKLEAEQEGLYFQQLQSLIADVEKTSDEEFRSNVVTFLGRRMTLFQICSNPSRLFPEYSETPAKIEALDGLLETLIEKQKEKVVLWSYFRHSLDVLYKRYSVYNPVKLDGSVAASADRSLAILKFQCDPNVRLFIGNPAAAGAGITLTSARIAVYESFSLQAAHYMQSLDRVHRRGQDRQVEYYILLCEGTIEEQEYERLLKKELYATELFGDVIKPTLRREVFLSELLRALERAN